jgi:predicted nucleotide-binding protein
MGKTGLSRAATYARIQKVQAEDFLPPNLAAIKLAAAAGIALSKFARPEELAQLRHRGDPVTPPVANGSNAPALGKTGGGPGARRASKGPSRKAPNQVFVVHGRDRTARESMYAFLRAVGVKPIEWNSALKMTRKAAPYIGDVLERAFDSARAIVVLMTPDDLAQLRPDLVGPGDRPYERVLTGQARPNVLFEAGRAFATHPDRTVIVQLGTLREFSDIAGLHVVHMSNDFDKRQELATKLQNAGCDVDTSGPDWVTTGNFANPMSAPIGSTKRRPKKR